MYSTGPPEIRLDARRIRNVLLIILAAMFVADGGIVVLHHVAGVELPAALVDRFDSDILRDTFDASGLLYFAYLGSLHPAVVLVTGER